MTHFISPTWIDPDIQGPWHHASFPWSSVSKTKHQLGHLQCGQVCLCSGIPYLHKEVNWAMGSHSASFWNLFSRIAGREISRWRSPAILDGESSKEKAGLPYPHFHSPGAPGSDSWSLVVEKYSSQGDVLFSVASWVGVPSLNMSTTVRILLFLAVKKSRFSHDEQCTRPQSHILAFQPTHICCLPSSRLHDAIIKRGPPFSAGVWILIHPLCLTLLCRWWCCSFAIHVLLIW